jgi:hypothetical protein
MDDQEKNSPMSPDTQAMTLPPLDAKGVARRRFARAGAGAAGVILTLHSQPGMAADVLSCASPSGFMSMKPGASAKPQQSCSYNRSHGYWKTHESEWQAQTGMATTALFGTFFACTGNYVGLANVTMMQVIDPNDAVKAIDRSNVAMQCATALLNARASRIAGIPSVLPEAKVIEIWTDFATNGYFAPGGNGTTPWTGAQIATYLESTFR